MSTARLSRRSGPREMPAARAVTAAEAVAYAIAHLSEKLSVIPERELKRVALLHGLGSVTLEQVDGGAAASGRHRFGDRRQADGDHRRVAGGRGLHRRPRGGWPRHASQPVGVPEGLSRTAGGRQVAQ